MNNHKLLTKLAAHKVAVSVLSVVVVASAVWGVSAFTNQSGASPSTVFENAQNVTINNLASEAEESFGAVTSPYLSGPEICIDDNCYYYMTQSFKNVENATTTFAFFATPFQTVSSTSSSAPVLRTEGTKQYIGVTSTVDFAAVSITGAATSSVSIDCGVSASKENAPTAPFIIDSGVVGTSTVAYIENNLTDNLSGATVTGSSTPKILVTPLKPYITCSATTADYADNTPITQATSGFDGEVTIRWHKLR